MKKLFLILMSTLILIAFGAFSAVPAMAAITINISPDASSAYTNDDLQCSTSTSGDFVYRWLEGANLISEGQTLSNANTQRDHTYTCIIYSRIQVGGSVIEYPEAEASRTILNSVPTTPTLTLSAGPYYINSQVYATATGSTDADGDALTVYYQTFANGVSTGTMSGPYGFVRGPIALFSHANMSVNAWVSDGTASSGIGSAIFTILNSAPVISNLNYSILNSTITINATATDADRDALNYSYQFDNLNDNITLQNYSANNSYAITNSSINDTIRAYVNATDGMNSTISFIDIPLTENATANITVPVSYNYCLVNSSNSPVSLKEITNDDKINGKKFKPLDEIEIKVKVDNADKDDKKDTVVSAVLVMNGTEVADTEVDKTITLKTDSYQTVILNMIIPEDIEAGNYQIYVKAYDDNKESNCQQTALDITVTKSNHEVIFKSTDISSNVFQGSVADIKGTVANIGKNDEDKVKIVYSDNLGNSFFEERNNLDSGDSFIFSFSAKVPANATVGEHTAKLKVYYDYDDNDGSYDDNSDEQILKINVLEKKMPKIVEIPQEATTTGEEINLGEWLNDNLMTIAIALEAAGIVTALSILLKRLF
jgi:hypothetical protein